MYEPLVLVSLLSKEALINSLANRRTHNVEAQEREKRKVPKVGSMERGWGIEIFLFTVCLSVLQRGYAICNLLISFTKCRFPFVHHFAVN